MVKFRCRQCGRPGEFGRQVSTGKAPRNWDYCGLCQALRRLNKLHPGPHTDGAPTKFGIFSKPIEERIRVAQQWLKQRLTANPLQLDERVLTTLILKYGVPYEILLQEMAEKKVIVFDTTKVVTIRLPSKPKPSIGSGAGKKGSVHPKSCGGTPYKSVSVRTLPGSFESGKRR
jgi:hypothetical protein